MADTPTDITAKLEEDISVAEKQIAQMTAAVSTALGTVRVTLCHPLTGDSKTVNGTPAELVPLMGRGYQQVKGAN